MQIISNYPCKQVFDTCKFPKDWSNLEVETQVKDNKYNDRPRKKQLRVIEEILQKLLSIVNRYSFFPWTTIYWNNLEQEIIAR